MTQKIQKIAPVILDAITKAHNILLHCHPSPDPDSIGSSLAMKGVLENMGKKVTLIAGDSTIKEAFSLFPGVETIVPMSFSQVNISNFDLFIIQDSASLDRISALVPPVFPPSLMTVNIDHHRTNPEFGTINLVEASYPATAAILYDLFTCWNIALTPPIATNLLIGIYTDTGGFKHPGTTVETFAIAAELIKLAPDFWKIMAKMDTSGSRDQIIYQGMALNSIETYCNDHVVIAAVSYDMLAAKKLDVDKISVNSISTLMKSVQGWRIAVSMVEKEPGKIKMSFRSQDGEKYDVAMIAASFGGGGHKAAAGATLTGTLAEAKKIVVDAISSVMVE
jgi:phosphoesterase RecJ-like protein